VPFFNVKTLGSCCFCVWCVSFVPNTAEKAKTFSDQADHWPRHLPSRAGCVCASASLPVRFSFPITHTAMPRYRLADEEVSQDSSSCSSPPPARRGSVWP
jgi:hypothetical protein